LRGILEVELEASSELGGGGEVKGVEVSSKSHLDSLAEVLEG